MLVLLREGRNFENALKARDNAIFDYYRLSNTRYSSIESARGMEICLVVPSATQPISGWWRISENS